MKKFLSFLLTFVMLFSLTMPAMAAEVTGDTGNDVTANFNPGAIEITGMEYIGDEATYDADSNTYTVVIPADTTNNANLSVKLVGTNLDLAEGSTHLQVKSINSSSEDVVIHETDSLIWGDFIMYWSTRVDGFWCTYQYSNDGGTTWSDEILRTEVKHGYSVTVNESENGFVTADKTLVAPGDTVSLNVSPVDGYMLDTLTVMNGETEVEVTNNSFTMPAGAVTVTAAFKEAPVYYSVTVNEPENGTVTVDPDKYTEGETVTLTVNPVSGYKLSQLTVMNGETPVEVTPSENNTYTFTMPEGDVTVNVTFEKITYAINIGTFEGGSVSSDVATAAEGDTVTLTVATTGIYQLKSITVKYGEDQTVDFTESSTVTGIYKFLMPASDVTVEATFEEVRIVAADLVWGSLAYTYTDADGWKNESSDANAGTVTVTNTGNVPFNTKATYLAEIDYMNIRGTFDNGATTLAAGENQSFKLTLHNRPKRILNGQKIGTVTVHISETEFTDYVTVTNEQELLNALVDGGTIKFSNDINVTSIDVLTIDSDVTIDLNEFTFDGIRFDIPENTTLDISNGTVAIRLDNYGELTVRNCTLDQSAYSMVNKAGTTRISSSALHGVVYVEDGTVELGADVTLNEGISGYIGLWCVEEGASIVCHFDPSNYLYTHEYINIEHNVTNNGDGTWTVTAK